MTVEHMAGSLPSGHICMTITACMPSWTNLAAAAWRRVERAQEQDELLQSHPHAAGLTDQHHLQIRLCLVDMLDESGCTMPLKTLSDAAFCHIPDRIAPLLPYMLCYIMPDIGPPKPDAQFGKRIRHAATLQRQSSTKHNECM